MLSILKLSTQLNLLNNSGNHPFYVCKHPGLSLAKLKNIQDFVLSDLLPKTRVRISLFEYHAQAIVLLELGIVVHHIPKCVGACDRVVKVGRIG